MPNLLKAMLQTGLYLLDRPDRAAYAVRDRIKEGVDWVGHGSRVEDHTLRYVLTFAVGVGVGLGVGILTAPASGDESRSAIAGKVQRASEKARPSPSTEGNIAAVAKGNAGPSGPIDHLGMANPVGIAESVQRSSNLLRCIQSGSLIPV